MWFRNISIYRLNAPSFPESEQLEQLLSEHCFTPCGGLDTHRVGWTEPLGRHGRQLLHVTNGRLMLCMRREDRILPPAVVREVLEEKLDQIETQEGRPVGRKEKSRLKDEIIVDLLPRAFTRSQRLFAYIDIQDGLIVIDTGTPKKAEELLNLLRDTLGSLKVRQIQVNHSPSLLMTRWVSDRPPHDFQLADECELREPVENGAIIRGRKLDLANGDIGTHIEAGMQVCRLAIEWNGRLRCILGEDLVIRRLRFTDVVMEEASDVAADDAAMRFDADFALMGAELAAFIPRLIEVLGGEESS